MVWRSNIPWICAGVVGIYAFSHVCHVLVKKFRRKSQEISDSHQVFFMNPLCTDQDCNVTECRDRRVTPLQIFSEIARRIDCAKFSIDIAIYVVTCFEVTEALLRARGRGVHIRVIVDNSLAHSSCSQVGTLMKSVDLRSFTAEDGLMHHKFCIIDATAATPGSLDTVFGCDGKSVLDCVLKWFPVKSVREGRASEGSSLLVTGSLNWTIRGMTANCENVIFTTDPALIRAFHQEFEKLWKHLAPAGT
ncbi:mitochondrial cardiolipin hydrolase [Lutzomyia longipalpis]|uniref:mitochondrial cardiolipin hydrolase n=1 Tax=Lutzomyia longipalpis TaxID=7200 RepID=UPI0024835A05|nr:mitochondrial cardiolipin hydrolase [Lutzomyia longipalpis]XP_055683824.1 mitochondrial cardiolipin hydrolase [Lutzomyia longipalpis]